MFFMTKADLAYLGQSAGWELGVGPSVVAVDAGMAKTLTTTTARAGIYAFIHLWSAGADGRPRPARIQDQQDRPVTTCEASRPDAASMIQAHLSVDGSRASTAPAATSSFFFAAST